MLKIIRLLTNDEFDKYLKLKESERSGAKAKKYIDSLNLFEILHDNNRKL